MLKNIIDIFRYRELLIRLASKEIKVRYKHPALGFLWMLLVPLSLALILWLVFSKILPVNMPEYPFLVFLITALFPWSFFSLSVSSSVMSILENGSLIKKVYFPREIIPISIVFANLINFILTLLVIVVFVVLFHIKFSLLLLMLPIVVILQILFTIGICLLVASLQVKFRDIKYIVEIVLTLWFYLCPVFYTLQHVNGISDKFINFYLLNPLAGLISLYRVAFLKGYGAWDFPAGVTIFDILLKTSLSCVIVFFLGLYVFKRQEPAFADYTQG